MSKRQSPASGITSADLSRLIREIEQEYLGHTVLELRIVPTRFGSDFTRLTVVAANFVGTHRTARNTRAAVQAQFPSHRYKTLLGCMYGCLYDLVQALEQARLDARGRQAEEEQAQMKLV